MNPELFLDTGGYHRVAKARHGLADRIFRTGLNLLEREIDGTKFRLIGIGVSEFMDPKLADPQDLVDPLATKRAKAETAMDTLRAKFGNQAVELGETFGKNKR